MPLQPVVFHREHFQKEKAKPKNKHILYFEHIDKCTLATFKQLALAPTNRTKKWNKANGNNIIFHKYFFS